MVLSQDWMHSLCPPDLNDKRAKIEFFKNYNLLYDPGGLTLIAQLFSI